MVRLLDFETSNIPVDLPNRVRTTMYIGTQGGWTCSWFETEYFVCSNFGVLRQHVSDLCVK